MKLPIRKLIILSSISLFPNFQIYTQSHSFHLNSGGIELAYRVTLPKDYSQSKRYPVLFVPGFEKVDDNYSVYLGATPSEYDWIIVESIAHLKPDFLIEALISKIRNQYSVKQLFLSGFSANSINLFRLSAKYIEMIDGIVAMPGYANDIDPTVLARNPDLKILLIVGEEDCSWKSKSVEAHKKLLTMGADVSFGIIPGEAHIMRGFAGAPFFYLLNNVLLGL